MKKFSLLTMTAVFTLTGCGPSGIKCKKIRIEDAGSTVLSAQKTFTTQSIYEYKEIETGKFIYTNFAPGNQNYNPDTGKATIKYYKVYLYENTITDKYRIFNYSNLVGKVKLTTDYFLDVSKHKVDVMTHYEKLEEIEYNKTPEEKAANSEAFSVIKNDFYQISNGAISVDDAQQIMKIYEDKVTKELETHEFLIYGDGASVYYTLED